MAYIESFLIYIAVMFVAYDKNDNGQIDGIDEVFGNLSESGFEEIKRVIDSNHDNKIDRKDELFYRLETWNDLNQDGKVQEGELKSLYDAGVKSIDLNYVSTDIDLNANRLTEASKYTDNKGDKELAADIQLNADVKDTKVEPEDIPNFTIDESTRELPQFKGSGLVYDAFIKYNIFSITSVKDICIVTISAFKSIITCMTKQSIISIFCIYCVCT